MSETSSLNVSIVRRSVFFLVLIVLTLANLFVLFNGLSSPQAMDQAQIAREISRGNGMTTKLIRPVAYSQAVETHGGNQVSMAGFQDTYHAPLNPLLNAAVLKIVGVDKWEIWKMKATQMIFPLDRVIAGVCVLFFLMSVAVNYLLVCRVFDQKIGWVCAVLMIFSQTFWEYSLSGLPQMLMMFLFSVALYFVYRAVEATEEERSSLIFAVIAGVFFTLLALTHWMAVWIALGYIIFAAIAFRPRSYASGALVVMLILAAVVPVIRANANTGSLFGTAFLTIYRGLGGIPEDIVMRANTVQDVSFTMRGLPLKIIRSAIVQTSEIIPLLGGIVVAPLFFLSLLHPFRRSTISTFRGGVLLMWLMTAIGLAFYGVSSDGVDPNQLHLIFAPIMTAFGLAFLSIQWNRLEFTRTNPAMKPALNIFLIVVCAMPLCAAFPDKIINGLFSSDTSRPQWPPYYPPGLNYLNQEVPATHSIFSDQPWATAWYSDRLSIWMPTKKDTFETLENAANATGTPVAGLLVSPLSAGKRGLMEIASYAGDFTSLVIDARVAVATAPNSIFPYQSDPKIKQIQQHFPFRTSLCGPDVIFYGKKSLRAMRESADQ